MTDTPVAPVDFITSAPTAVRSTSGGSTARPPDGGRPTRRSRSTSTTRTRSSCGRASRSTTRPRSCSCCSATTAHCCSTPAPPKTGNVPASRHRRPADRPVVGRAPAGPPERRLRARRGPHPRPRRPRRGRRPVRGPAGHDDGPRELDAVERTSASPAGRSKSPRSTWAGASSRSPAARPSRHRHQRLRPVDRLAVDRRTVYPGRLYDSTSPRLWSLERIMALAEVVQSPTSWAATSR